MTYTPEIYETALWRWVDRVVGGVVDEIRFANQPYPVERGRVVTIQVLQVQEEVTPLVTLERASNRYRIESGYTGTVSIQVYGKDHRQIARAIQRSLWHPPTRDHNTGEGVEIRRVVSPAQDLTAIISTDYLGRTGIDFEFSFRDVWVDPETSGVITSVQANDLLIEQGQRLAAEIHGRASVRAVLGLYRIIDGAQIQGRGVVDASITRGRHVEAYITGASSVSATLNAKRATEAQVSGLASVSASIDASRGVSATVGGRAIVGATLDVIGPYDKILDLNPALFVQFKYAQYGGQQVLFRDDAATDPVTDPGQHTIGAAVDLVSGAPWEKQPSAARKPLWDEGAIFDGLDDYLVGDNPIGISPRTVIAKGTVFGAQRGTLAGTRASTTHGYGMQAEANGNFRIITSVATPAGSLMLSPGWTLGDPFVVSHTYDEDLAPGDTTWLGIAGGASVSNSQIDEGEDHELLGIGGLPFTNGRDFLDGKIEAVAIWNRVLTPEEIQIIEEALL